MILKNNLRKAAGRGTKGLRSGPGVGTPLTGTSLAAPDWQPVQGVQSTPCPRGSRSAPAGSNLVPPQDDKEPVEAAHTLTHHQLAPDGSTPKAHLVLESGLLPLPCSPLPTPQTQFQLATKSQGSSKVILISCPELPFLVVLALCFAGVLKAN